MIITTSGTHFFDRSLSPGSMVLLDLAGTVAQFNGATATIGYKAADGLFSPCLKSDGSSVDITSRGGFSVRVPRSGQVGIQLSAAPAAGGLILDVVQSIEVQPLG